METIQTALELMPLLKVVNPYHRLGIEVTIDRDRVKYALDEYDSTWIHARKNRMPSFFTLIYAGVDKQGLVIVDNYCNVEEDGSNVGDRGECTMYFDGNKLVQLHDLS